MEGLSMTTPESVTIGGLEGVVVDVSVTPGWVGLCEFSQENNGPPIYDGPLRLFNDNAGNGDVSLSAAVDEMARVFILDRGDSQILVIVVRAQGQAAWNALVADAMPIIDTFEFTR